MAGKSAELLGYEPLKTRYDYGTRPRPTSLEESHSGLPGDEDREESGAQGDEDEISKDAREWVRYALASAKIVRFVRLAEGRSKVELFHLRRDRVDYFVVLQSGTSLSYDIKAKGSSAAVARAFDLELENLLKGTRMFSGTPEIVADKPDAKARKTVEAFDHPTFGLDWAKELETEKDDPEAEDFHKLLERQLHAWKGGRHSLPLVKHRYWPTFRKMVIEAIAKKWGTSFNLFRGVYGDQAVKILDEGAPLHVYRFSSWTIDRTEAKDFAVHPHGSTGKKHFWIVVRAPFKATDVIFAPVVLPDFTPNSRILKEHFTWETEFVVDAKTKELKPGQFQVVAKTRAKRVAKEHPSTMYHLTTDKRAVRIMSQGLKPQLGRMSREWGEKERVVWLFGSLREAKHGVLWFYNYMEPDDRAVILSVNVRGLDVRPSWRRDDWFVTKEPIPSSRLKVEWIMDPQGEIKWVRDKLAVVRLTPYVTKKLLSIAYLDDRDKPGMGIGGGLRELKTFWKLEEMGLAVVTTVKRREYAFPTPAGRKWAIDQGYIEPKGRGFTLTEAGRAVFGY